MVKRKNPITEYLRKIGRKGGLVSGAARMTNLTPEKRSEVARIAPAARWSKRKPVPTKGK